MSQKRKNYLTWDEYFMSIVSLSSIKGEYSCEGACLVSSDHRILSIGYEDIPCSIKNTCFDSTFVLSALSNAIYSFNGKRREFEGGTVYLSSFPNCDESRWIAQGRFSRVLYFNKKVPADVETVSSIILENAGVEVETYFDDWYVVDSYHAFLEELRTVMKRYIALSEEKKFLDREYFMGISLLSALRSKDPSTQVGACLTDRYNKILSVGYNGTPFGMSDDVLPWASFGEETGDLVTTKNPYIVHAEINILDNYRGVPKDFSHGTLFLLYSPCDKCAARLSYTLLDQIVFLRAYTKDGMFDRSHVWLSCSSISYGLYNPEKDYTKDECLEMIEETTKVIKKNLKK